MKKSLLILGAAAVVFVAYLAGCKKNQLPVIDDFRTDPASDTVVTVGDTVSIICQASDPDGDPLFYELEADGGTLQGTPDGGDIIWIAPEYSGTYNIICNVTDLEGDTVNVTSQTLSIHVQNYFPMAVGSRWSYEGEAFVTTVTLEITVRSQVNQGGDEVRWNVTRVFDSPSIPSTTDTFSYYIVKGDEVFFNDASLGADYLVLSMPLWADKTWDADDNIATGSVEEKKDRGTDAGIFSNCMHIELQDLAGGQEDRTVWVAPDVGIIVQSLEVTLGTIEGEIEFELVDYELK